MGIDAIRVFIGYDPRQPIAAQVLAHSIWERSSRPVSITRLKLSQLPIKRKGLTEFTFSRYLVPHLCGYAGNALFIDADMLCLGDIAQLDELCRLQGAPVCVVPHNMVFERPSLMYFNNALCQNLTPRFIEEGQPQMLKWAASVGAIPHEWNHLVGYDKPRLDAKIVHFTQGIPFYEEVEDCEYADEWRSELANSMSTVSWTDLMGGSVHAPVVLARKGANLPSTGKGAKHPIQ